MHLNKQRWGIETTFRVQDEVTVKSKSREMLVRYFLFPTEALIYNLWKFFKAGVSFAVFVLVQFVRIIIERVVMAIREAAGRQMLKVEDVERMMLKEIGTCMR